MRILGTPPRMPPYPSHPCRPHSCTPLADVTSSNPSIGGVLTGLGIAPNKLGAVIGVVRMEHVEHVC